MTTMATLLCSLRLPPPSSSSPIVHRLSSSRSTAISMKKSKLSSSTSVSGFPVALPRIHSPTRPPPPLHPQNQPALTVVAAKGYKMKTHKASAKRFRVTGRGKIVRRRAWKQHLLSKKTTKRKLRLSKMEAFLSDLKALNPGLCVTAAYGNILPSKFLEIPLCGAYYKEPEHTESKKSTGNTKSSSHYYQWDPNTNTNQSEGFPEGHCPSN